MRTKATTCLLVAAACSSDVANGVSAGFGSAGSSTSSGPPVATDTGDTTTTTSGSGPADESSGGAKFDLAAGADISADDLCPDHGENELPEFSYIWIANTLEGTVSKIDTQTMVELGRYIVRPDSAGSPSRTSVNLRGDVAVANRLGGLTKIFARIEECSAALPTSTGGDDIVPWMDGCIAWHVPLDYVTQRPVAWTPGELSPITCEYENAKVWTSGAKVLDGPNAAMEVLLLDGETGVVEHTVELSGLPVNFYGIYGGASDADGNFWGIQNDGRVLIRVDRDTLAVETWDEPPGNGYGFTVDAQGRPWTCDRNVARFDPATETWATRFYVGAMGAGCMADGAGRLWIGMMQEGKADDDFLPTNHLLAFDLETMEIVRDFALPNFAKGVSIDYFGNVWAVSEAAEAYRVDPETGEISTFTGLVGAYTYSDMTGFALGNVVGLPPAG